MKQTRRWAGKIAFGALILVLLLAGGSALSNINLPAGPAQLDRLSPMDKARLSESLNLKSAVGEPVWPGWGKMDVPIVIWNRETEFLIGLPSPPQGWEAVPDDTFEGQIYYRRPADNPQNFAVRLGDAPNDVWAASMGAKWEADLFLREKFQEMLPPVLKQIMPYRLLILPSEVQITGVLHETFHVYQAQVASDRLSAAEAAQSREHAYFQADASMAEAWAAEAELLRSAVEAGTKAEMATLARQFLAQRKTRRAQANLAPNLVDFERQLEWEEGLAKYVELTVWRGAREMSTWQPVPGLAEDGYFKAYATFNQRWSQEMGVLVRSSNEESTTRFYYTGMAQATLLDRLAPGWKAQAMQPDVWLEDLLAAAVAQP